MFDWLLPVANHLKITADNANAEHLRYAAVPIVSYILIALGVCLVVNVFHPLKSPDEKGLINSLARGLMVGIFPAFLGNLFGVMLYVLFNFIDVGVLDESFNLSLFYTTIIFSLSVMFIVSIIASFDAEFKTR